MSTWEELTKDVLFTLGEKRSASVTNEIREQVVRKLTMKRDEVYGLRPPKSLLVYSSYVEIPSTLDYISITASGSGDTPGWNLSNYWRVFGIAMSDGDNTDIANSQDWDFIEWDSWVRSNSAIDGDQRLDATFTVDYQNRVYLSNLPGENQTWNAWIHYYKTPATIADDDTPDIGVEFENVLVLGAALEFPDLFRGEERPGIYAATVKRYDQALTAYLRANTPKRSGSRRRPFRKRHNYSSVNWGGLRTS